MLARLRKDDNPTVRQNAAWALGRLKSAAAPAVVTGLIEASEKDADPLVRRDAATALGDLLKCRRSEPFDLSTREDAVRALFALARAESARGDKGDPVVQKTALVKLYSVVTPGDKRDADLIADLVKHEDPETARLAAFILAKSTNDTARKPEVVRTIARSLNDEELRYQEEAAVCLAALERMPRRLCRN